MLNIYKTIFILVHFALFLACSSVEDLATSENTVLDVGDAGASACSGSAFMDPSFLLEKYTRNHMGYVAFDRVPLVTVNRFGELISLRYLDKDDPEYKPNRATSSNRLTSIHMPYPDGDSYKVTQGNGGTFSHDAQPGYYAVDYSMTDCQEIAAVASGRVIDVKESSNSGCSDSSCADQGNYVYIDHGKGSIGIYYHLYYMGATVALGDSVDRGQVIGLAGNTGYSTGTHLHFQLNDYVATADSSRGESYQVTYTHSGGTTSDLQASTTYTSSNTRTSGGYTTTVANLSFSQNGVTLTEDIPIIISKATGFNITGSCSGGSDKAALWFGTKVSGSIEPIASTAWASASNSFGPTAYDVSGLTSDTTYYLMMDCSSTGSYSSIGKWVLITD